MSITGKTKKLILIAAFLLAIGTIIFVVFQKQVSLTKKFASTTSKFKTSTVSLSFDSTNDNCVPPKDSPPIKLSHMALGVSDFYYRYNQLFVDEWKCHTGETIEIEQKYGISGEIMRNMIKGELTPHVVTLSNPAEMDNVATLSGVISPTWRNDFPFESSPYYSSVVFLVRKDNPLNIKDWNDLVKPGVDLLASNPQACGGGRWVYTAALGFAMNPSDGVSNNGEEYLSQFYNNLPVLYPDQGKAGDAFMKKGVGDVLVTYEKFALLQQRDDKPVEVIAPSKTVAIDVPIAVAEKYAQRDGVTDIAIAYINGLYDPVIQKIIAEGLFRPRVTKIPDDLVTQFPNLQLFTRKDVFGNNDEKERAHLGNGGFFESIKTW